MTSPKQNMSAKGKCMYPNLKWTSKNNTSVKMKYLLLHTLKHKAMSDSMHLNLLLSPLSVPSCSSHSLLTFLSSSLPIHNVSQSVPSTVLDIQHFLKFFSHFRWDVLSCHCDPQWSNNTTAFLGLQTY